MAWAKPQYSREEINKAASIVANYEGHDFWEYTTWLDIVNNWRASHNFPLNTMQNGLRRNAKQVNKDCLVAQRIKRLTSIAAKLQRFPDIKLSQMQDIGGCRAIMDSISEVNRVVEIYKKSEIKHKLLRIDDYISQPRNTGYRSVHLIYKYYSDKRSIYNDLKVEIQIRTKLQHAWATAVETVGAFTKQALKSSQGEQSWLRFFELMGSAIAIREKTPSVPNTPTDPDQLKEELIKTEKSLRVLDHLNAYRTIPVFLETPQSEAYHYYVLELDPSNYRLKFRGYPQKALESATADYLETEKQCSGESGKDAVLVSVDSLSLLKKAYPNYFADTHLFISEVEKALK